MTSSTIDRILDAAEVEFAAHGFVETSLRTITSKAKVNLAAVNYHFGSKKGLIQAVTDRFLGPLTQNLQAQLSAYEQSSHKSTIGEQELQALFGILARSCQQVAQQNQHSLAVFARLINMAYSQSQGHLRKHLTYQYGSSFLYFMKLLRQHMPVMNNEQFFWRFHYLLGTLVFALSSSESLVAICEREYEVSRNLDQIMSDLVLVMARAAQAPITGEYK
ncbi:MAG: TetR/AcrR family transcriptional regulator [Gammaproteobacteria bacterium]|nr:TetR/AcrR family transcriptional regulator [Gammaproteobacteria bacterium]